MIGTGNNRLENFALRCHLTDNSLADPFEQDKVQLSPLHFLVVLHQFKVTLPPPLPDRKPATRLA